MRALIPAERTMLVELLSVEAEVHCGAVAAAY